MAEDVETYKSRCMKIYTDIIFLNKEISKSLAEGEYSDDEREKLRKMRSALVLSFAPFVRALDLLPIFPKKPRK